MFDPNLKVYLILQVCYCSKERGICFDKNAWMEDASFDVVDVSCNHRIQCASCSAGWDGDKHSCAYCWLLGNEGMRYPIESLKGYIQGDVGYIIPSFPANQQ